MSVKSTPPIRLIGCNTENDGTCRTIKANYYKVSRINFQNTKDWGATGAILIYEK